MRKLNAFQTSKKTGVTLLTSFLYFLSLLLFYFILKKLAKGAVRSVKTLSDSHSFRYAGLYKRELKTLTCELKKK